MCVCVCNSLWQSSDFSQTHAHLPVRETPRDHMNKLLDIECNTTQSKSMCAERCWPEGGPTVWHLWWHEQEPHLTPASLSLPSSIQIGVASPMSLIHPRMTTGVYTRFGISFSPTHTHTYMWMKGSVKHTEWPKSSHTYYTHTHTHSCVHLHKHT